MTKRVYHACLPTCIIETVRVARASASAIGYKASTDAVSNSMVGNNVWSGTV